MGTRYVALLRGINVGGKNVIKMTDLRACFEAQGCVNVQTYIASGNVIFTAPQGGSGALGRRLEGALGKAFDYRACLVLRTRQEMQHVVRCAPTGFGAQPKAFRYDVIFLKPPLTAATAMKDVRAKPGVDEAFAGEGVLYFSRLIAKASQSWLTRLTSQPVYQKMTIRNWNTTTKLLDLM